MSTPSKPGLPALGPARAMALAAFVLGIVAAAINADAWWFLLGVMTFVLLFFGDNPDAG
ncbi:hypothetical protein [Amycolatopsis sp.]|uniref:hypothetical protein n=1 Tax=Amycolatopsis sp. TaxID=37632 RepID=UPI002C507303|nr:hypothetical protein [Amycolatopsis sp.]HVV12258.1 hypothetical protein [Amycolatopsis sp.]